MSNGMPESGGAFVDITVNGERRAVPAGQTVLGLLESFGISPERVAVEFNGEILRRERWNTTLLAGGEQLEIVHFVGGG
jgi:thiamine biosynthesis protein ThiS